MITANTPSVLAHEERGDAEQHDLGQVRAVSKPDESWSLPLIALIQFIS